MNFPVAGAPPAVAAWLRTQLFKEDIIEIFANWDADAMLNVSEMDLKEEVPGREGKRLWALLTSTKKAQGQYLTTTNIPIESLRTCVTILCLGVTINTTSSHVIRLCENFLFILFATISYLLFSVIISLLQNDAV